MLGYFYDPGGREEFTVLHLKRILKIIARKTPGVEAYQPDHPTAAAETIMDPQPCAKLNVEYMATGQGHAQGAEDRPPC